jgi:DNA-binding NarL/FixJ family response regulator
MKRITILLADDHKLIRETWAFVLNKDPRFEVISQVSSGTEAIESAGKCNPDIILMDINMSPINGFETTELILKNSPASKVIALSMNSMPAYTRKMIQIGGHGYITKNSSLSEMTSAILEVYNGNTFFCEEVKLNLVNDILGQKETQNPDINKLSNREIQITKFIKTGYSSKEIAKEMNISSKTVEVHRYNILKKLSLKNTASLVNFINQHPV